MQNTGSSAQQIPDFFTTTSVFHESGTNQSKNKNPAGAKTDTNFGAPLQVAPTEAQLQAIRESEKHDAAMKQAYEKALNENFSTYVFPQEYYQQQFSKQNSHLPPVDFASYYATLAFKYTKKDDFVNVRYFVKKFNFVDVYDEEGNNLLMTSAAYNSIKTARMLLANHILHINAQNKQNLRTPLHFAVINANYDMARLLLSMGASIAIHDSANMTPLDYSTFLDNSQINNLLLAYKH